MRARVGLLLLPLVLASLLPHAGAQPATRGHVEGRLVAEDGTPIGAVDAFVIFPGFPRDVALGHDGTFRHEVPAGRVSGAVVPSGADDVGCLEVRPGETLWLNLTLPRAG